MAEHDAANPCRLLSWHTTRFHARSIRCSTRPPPVLTGAGIHECPHVLACVGMMRRAYSSALERDWWTGSMQESWMEGSMMRSIQGNCMHRCIDSLTPGLAPPASSTPEEDVFTPRVHHQIHLPLLCQLRRFSPDACDGICWHSRCHACACEFNVCAHLQCIGHLICNALSGGFDLRHASMLTDG